MLRSPPRHLTPLLAFVLVAAGCLSGGPGAAGPSSPTPETPSPTPEPTSSPPPGTPAATPTPGGHEHAANQPDPDKAVQLHNEWNRTVDVHVRVIHEATTETVHNETYTLAPDTERNVYTTARAAPDGIEAFRVVVTARNATERVTVRTNECYGDAHGNIREDGSLYLFYAIC